MSNKLDKERSAVGGGSGAPATTSQRQNLVTTNSARKFIIVPAAIATTSGPTSNPGNCQPVTVYSNPTVQTGGSGGTISHHLGNEEANNAPGPMGRSLKFHSMRSVRGKRVR